MSSKLVEDWIILNRQHLDSNWGVSIMNYANVKKQMLMCYFVRRIKIENEKIFFFNIYLHRPFRWFVWLTSTKLSSVLTVDDGLTISIFVELITDWLLTPTQIINNITLINDFRNKFILLLNRHKKSSPLNWSMNQLDKTLSPKLNCIVFLCGNGPNSTKLNSAVVARQHKNCNWSLINVITKWKKNCVRCVPLK